MKVQTVLGPIKSEELGRTLTHEHLCIDVTSFCITPPESIKHNFEGKITLEKLGYIRQLPYSCLDNLKISAADTKEAILFDVCSYKKFGGGSIVDNTTNGLHSDAVFLKEISEKTKVHVIAGAGFYTSNFQNQSTLSMSKEEIYKQTLGELVEGFEAEKTVKAGFMGEIASTWPIHDFEKRVIKACGEIQEQFGCPISFHPHWHKDAPFEVMRLYMEAGGRANKAVMSHLDLALKEDEDFLEFSKIGSYCQLDFFGVEVSYCQFHPTLDIPSDAWRVSKIKLLKEEGKIDKILMSHDIHSKHRLIRYGGHGYSHIINNTLPMMKLKGFDDQEIDQITIKNPANWLEYQF